MRTHVRTAASRGSSLAYLSIRLSAARRAQRWATFQRRPAAEAESPLIPAERLLGHEAAIMRLFIGLVDKEMSRSFLPRPTFARGTAGTFLNRAEGRLRHRE